MVILDGKEITAEELNKDINNLSRFYSRAEILNQYKEIGIELTNEEFAHYKYLN